MISTPGDLTAPAPSSRRPRPSRTGSCSAGRLTRAHRNSEDCTPTCASDRTAVRHDRPVSPRAPTLYRTCRVQVLRIVKTKLTRQRRCVDDGHLGYDIFCLFPSLASACIAPSSSTAYHLASPTTRRGVCFEAPWLQAPRTSLDCPCSRVASVRYAPFILWHRDERGRGRDRPGRRSCWWGRVFAARSQSGCHVSAKEPQSMKADRWRDGGRI